MKFLSFRILLLCMVLPPVLYVSTLILLERHAQSVYEEKIQQIYIGDTQPLLEGEIRLREAIEKNIQGYLQKRRLIRWGLNIRVTVASEGGILLYPSLTQISDPITEDRHRIAAENFQLMNEDLIVEVDSEIPHNTPLSNLILGLYVFFSLMLLYFYHRLGLKRIQMADLERQQEFQRLQDQESSHRRRLDDLALERESLGENLEGIKKALLEEREKASKSENGMIEEIIRLEERLQQNLDRQQEKEAEIDSLKEQLDLYEAGKLRTGKQKAKDEEIFRKRFQALYKNVTLHQRAITGFSELPEDLKIRAEELIHLLNDDSGKVTIKRKVFGKKNRETVLEVLFSYKGRLYFRKTEDGRIEILTIGTKNTQNKDLEFINNL